MKQEMRIAIHETLEALVSQYGTAELERVIEFVDINTGRVPLPALPKYQRPLLFYFPGLDGKPWYEASDYPALEAFTSTLEASVDVLREEFLAQVTTPMLLPYEEQVAGRFESIRRNDWGSFYFRRKGEPEVEENCRRCPRTAALMRQVQDFLSPSGAFIFSVIQGGTRIPPHTDTTNLKLTCQLPLIVPRGSRLRVGDEIREWPDGRAIIFDDTFEHESWNDSNEPRVCLLVDIWHPGITRIERDAVERLDAAISQHLGLDFRPPWAEAAAA
ncbi:aspartyl/asparaginyl beta-hydroxylase domain-containing protein [Burkholderia sp. AU45274]|uniref:aspartyl/asparaginyl beta-hydroxylase domain-containing protein n=1 Tax=Burkholderia sp. AU45274 TaxID=3059205 RepID=UPI0026532F8B|nr:aspartyl/asparaginyl beta-hydroxylase domain-containing protein [Burkholderia sp. AU45274]MDN7489056.1 aspartyl/asparaginyl beta-hydroxylase domain-containing protein [Burkholderia sp. AU45274]